MVATILRQARQQSSKSISLISVQGSQAFWELHGFHRTGQRGAVLTSYGSGAVHMHLTNPHRTTPHHCELNEGIHLDLDTWIVPGQIR